MSDRYSATEVIDVITAIDADDSESRIVKYFSDFIAKLGFESIALGYLMTPFAMKNQNFQVTDWPEDWYKRWYDSDYIIHDPIARYALKTRYSFTWSTAYTHSSKFGKTILELVSIHVYARLEVITGPRPKQQVKGLSKRETDVLQYAASGKTNWEIGTILSISEYTVREYMTSAMRKLDCVNRAHTVAVAIQKSLILP